MTALGTKSRNFNPIGIFKDCDTRDKVVNLSIAEAHRIFVRKGYSISVPSNPDTGGDHDFIISKGMEALLVSCKSTTQMTRSKNPKPYISVRTNSKAKNNYGKVTVPTNYHFMIGISHIGTYCIWTKEDLMGVKSSVAFGNNNGEGGEL